VVPGEKLRDERAFRRYVSFVTLTLREIWKASDRSPSEWRGVDEEGMAVVIRYREGALCITRGNDAGEDDVVCFRLLGSPDDSFMTEAQMRLEVGEILDLP
jgi:hypothetical protein